MKIKLIRYFCFRINRRFQTIVRVFETWFSLFSLGTLCSSTFLSKYLKMFLVSDKRENLFFPSNKLLFRESRNLPGMTLFYTETTYRTAGPKQVPESDEGGVKIDPNLLKWGDSMIRDTPKLFFTHTGNLIPPSDRAYGTILMKKKISDSRNHEKNKIFEPETWDWGTACRAQICP